MSYCKVSIIVLTYNNFNNLEKNLTSIIHQSFKDYEVIIQDDHSPGFDCEWIYSIIKSLNTDDKFKVYSNSENLGTVKNMSLAIERAQGEIIVPIAQDDYFYNNDVLQYIVKHFEKTNCDYCCAKRLGSVKGIIFPDNFDEKIIVNSFNDNSAFLTRLVYGNCISGASFYYKKDAFLRDGGYDDRYFLLEDYPLILKLVSMGIHISFLDYPTIVYGEDGISNGSYSDAFIKDEVLFHKHFGAYSDTLFKSKLVKKYVKYKELKWNSFINKSQRIPTNLWNVLLFLGVTKILSLISNKSTKEIRVNYFWKFEGIKINWRRI